MEKVSTLSKYTLIGVFLTFCSIAGAQDFKVQHIQADVDENNTIVNTTSITHVSSITSAFAIPGNNKMTHAGRADSNNGDLQGDDMAGARVLTGTNTLTYYRESASHNDADGMNFQTMIWEYTGAASGANEFIVRGRYTAVLNGSTSSAAIDLTSAGIVNANNCIPFITGIMNDDDTDGADSGTAIAWLSSTTNMEVRKGTKSNDVTVYITVVEFTGSNWTVLHGVSGGDSANTGTINLTSDSDGSGTTAAVSNWDNSMIFTQSKAQTYAGGDVKEYVNAQWPIIEPGSDNQSVDWTFDSGRGTDDTGPSRNKSNHLVHVLENPEISVARFTDTSSADDESTIDITSASLTALDQSMIIGTSISSGSDYEYGRGWRNYYFNSITEAAHWSHRSGSTMSHNIQIINLDAPVVTQSEGPGGITADLQLWLKADEGVEEAASDEAEDGDSVLNWLDNTANANDATQSTGANQPVFTESAINFNPVIDFDGTHEMTTTTSTNDDITIFAVTEGTYSTTKSLLDLDNGSNGKIEIEQTGTATMQGSYTDNVSSTSGIATNDLTSITSGTPYLLNYRQQTTGGKNRMFINGIIQTLPASDTNANTLSGNFTVGIGADPSDSSTRWNGGIAEMIIYNQKVAEADRKQIESYLALKYGITLGTNGTSMNYVDSDNRTIWDITANSGYNNNITGVGRDDTSTLNQKQSKTIHDTNDITVGIKNIATSNNANACTFMGDKTFLIWGHDGATGVGTDITKDFGGGTGVSGASLTASRINRTWKMVVTDSVPTVKLSIPESMVSPARTGSEDYIMIVADDASFSTNITSATMEVNGSDLEVDFYFEGTKYITFGSAPEVALGDRAVYFDNYGATDTYLDAGDVNDLNDTDFTISAWVRRDSGAEKFDIVSKRNYFDEYIHPTDSLQDQEGYYDLGYAFRINKTGQFRMVWRDPDDTANNQLQTKETIPANEWHHIAASYDISENMAILYIDGIHVYDSDDFFDQKGWAIKPLNSNTDSHFMIGAAHHIKRQQKVRGSIDEVRVWNVALSPNQLRYIMNQEIIKNGDLNADGKVLPSETTLNDIDAIPWNNLIAYYPMSNAVFGSIKDESNSRNDASMINYNNLEEQTAPLPYKTKSGGTGAWDDPDTWVNGDVQYLPGVTSYLTENYDWDDDGDIDDFDKQTMDYNIVQIDHEITLDNNDTDLIPNYKEKNRRVLGLIVNNGGKLQVDGDTSIGTGNAITISHYLKVDGEIDLEGESQLIQTNDSDLDVGTNGRLERDQQGTNDLYTYNYWSSPVGLADPSVINSNPNRFEYTLPDILNDGLVASNPLNLTFTSSGYNGSPGTANVSGATIADYWIWKYANKTSGTYSEWQHMRSTGTIKAGEGFTMKGVSNTESSFSETQNYIFNGKPNNGDISVDISIDNDYLVGNPYPSAIDADEFIKDNLSTLEVAAGGRNADGNIINGVLYFWEHFASKTHALKEYQGGYGTYTLIGGTQAITTDALINTSGSLTSTKGAPKRYIPVSQGFFVSAKSDGLVTLTQPIAGGSIVFKNSQRIFKTEASPSTSIFLKSSGTKSKSIASTKTNEDTRQKIRLMFDSPRGYHRQLLVGLDEKTSNGFDAGFDAPLLDIGKEDMFWLFDETNFVIQAVNNFDVEQKLPLGVKIFQEGLATIKIDELENIDTNLDIYLHDKELEIYHDLNESNYEVYLSSGTYKERFEVTFSKGQSLGIEELDNSNLQTYYSNEKQSLVLHNPNLKDIQSVELFNILGQSIYKLDKIETENYREFKTRKINSGTYIIKTKTIDGVNSKKVMIK